MEKQTFFTHISQAYNVDLMAIINKTITMGEMVQKNLKDVMHALYSKDAERAIEIAQKDKEVNDIEISIEESCVNILATRQPAASDLRLVVAVSNIASNLERVGDEAVTIGRLAAKMAEQDVPLDEYGITIHLLYDLVSQNLSSAMSAFESLDLNAAVTVVREDKEINNKYEGLIRQMALIMMENSSLIPWALDMIWIARSLERIGDHTKNLGEFVVYLVKGKDVRHFSVEEIEREVQN